MKIKVMYAAVLTSAAAAAFLHGKLQMQGTMSRYRLCPSTAYMCADALALSSCMLLCPIAQRLHASMRSPSSTQDCMVYDRLNTMQLVLEKLSNLCRPC